MCGPSYMRGRTHAPPFRSRSQRGPSSAFRRRLCDAVRAVDELQHAVPGPDPNAHRAVEALRQVVRSETIVHSNAVHQRVIRAVVLEGPVPEFHVHDFAVCAARYSATLLTKASQCTWGTEFQSKSNVISG